MAELAESFLAASAPIGRVAIACQIPRLPLAVYREVAAHLRQVEGVGTELLPQTASAFDYLQSQVGGIRVEYPIAIAAQCQSQVAAILAHYAERYGTWQPCDEEPTGL